MRVACRESVQIQRSFQILDLVGLFPGDVRVVLAKVTVVGGLGVNRAEQVELPDDVRGLEAENFADGAFDVLVGHDAGAKRVHTNRNGIGITDGVGELNLRARRQARGHDVLRHITAHVRRAAVHLRRVFAAERAAAVPAHAAVAVHDDFAPGQTGVALRSADHETAGRIDEELGVPCRANVSAAFS